MLLLNFPFCLKTLIFKLMLLDLFLLTLYENFCEQMLSLWGFALFIFLESIQENTNIYASELSCLFGITHLAKGIGFPGVW